MERALISRSAQAPSIDSLDSVDIPEPARRYLVHALGSDNLLAGAMQIRMVGKMAPKTGAERVSLSANEILAPPHGFIWAAQLRMKGIPIHVRDLYVAGSGRIAVEMFGLVPIQSDGSADVTRSSRHRLAAEAVWCPSALLPRDGARWEGIDPSHARVVLTIDGEDIPLTLAIDDDGRLQEVMIHRWGNVGVAEWQLIPYGFRVDAEASFGGITIPSRLSGGWWYGTDQFDPASAAEFVLIDARPAFGTDSRLPDIRHERTTTNSYFTRRRARLHRRSDKHA